MITVTDKAVTAVRRMSNTEVYPAAGLRIKTVNGNSYAMAIVPQPAPDDLAVRSDGANIYLDHDAVQKLEQATLDATENARTPDQFSLV